MKTPMQELLDHLESYDINIDTEFYKGLLESEKQHIINAVNITEKNAVDFCNEAVLKYYNHEGLFGVEPDAGINYYNETYKDNE